MRFINLLYGLLLSALSVGCAVKPKDIMGTYQSTCLLYSQPSVVLVLKDNKTFTYQFAQLQDKVEGKWSFRRDSLILTSDEFMRLEDNLTPLRKITNIPGKDVFFWKKAKLFFVTEKGLNKECHLQKINNRE